MAIKLMGMTAATAVLAGCCGTMAPEEAEPSRTDLLYISHVHRGGGKLERPFQCDFGTEIYLGEKAFVNFNCTILDGAKVTIGEDCWIGGHVTILPGVTIGSRSIVAAGSVVVDDVPSDVMVAGNPAVVKRHLV